jgi:hypothetical protein
MAEKSRQTDGKNLVWFGEIERKLAKLLMPTLTYRSSFLIILCSILSKCQGVSTYFISFNPPDMLLKEQHCLD